jgi:hypothetical protein
VGFRLVQYGACGHLETAIAGYSARQRKALLYPIVSSDGARSYWHDNLFPGPDDAARATRRRYQFRCLDHGNDRYTAKEFAYDPLPEAWRQTWGDGRDCKAVDGVEEGQMPSGFFRVGDTTIAPGGEASLEIGFKSLRGGKLSIEMEVAVEGAIGVRATASGTPDCTAGHETPGTRGTGSEHSPASFWFGPPRCMSPDSAPNCRLTTVIGARVELTFPAMAPDDPTPIYRCRLTAPDGALEGSYDAWISKIRIYASSGNPVQANGTDGCIGVAGEQRQQ